MLDFPAIAKNMESEERDMGDVSDQEELNEFNLEGEFHEDDLETSGALVCSTPAPAIEIPTIVVDEPQVISLCIPDSL